MRNACLTKIFGHSTLFPMPVWSFFFEFLFFYVPFFTPLPMPGFYTSEIYQDLIWKNFKGSRISSRLKEHKKTKAG
jgi:hypothetical protein